MIERIAIDALLVPLPETVVGTDLREGGPGSDTYLAIKDDRAAARLAEREASNAESDSDPLRAGLGRWSELADGAVAILSEQAKDLEVAAWLAEALLRTGGIAGLADGFKLLDGLIRSFWDEGLWPRADDEGDEDRLVALFGLFGRGGTGTLLQPLKLIPLADRGDAPVTLWSAEVAFAPPPPRSTDDDAQALADERRAAALDAVTGGIGRSSRDFLIALRHDLVRAIAGLNELMSTIDGVSTVGRFGSQIGEPLAAALKLLEDNAGAVFLSDIAAEAAIDDDGDAAPTAIGNGTAGPVGAPRSREQALGQVLLLADYFETHEPQAPVGPALRDVVRRARLPLETLLAELLPDVDVRTLFLQRAGIKSTSLGVDDYD